MLHTGPEHHVPCRTRSYSRMASTKLITTV